MRRTLVLLLALPVLLLIAAMGAVLLMQAFEILQAGEITYARKRHPAVTASPENHPFSYYYQLAFFFTLGLSLVLMVLSLGLHAVAKALRKFRDERSRAGSILHAQGNLAAIGCGACFAAWVVLHMLRYWSIA